MFIYGTITGIITITQICFLRAHKWYINRIQICLFRAPQLAPGYKYDFLGNHNWYNTGYKNVHLGHPNRSTVRIQVCLLRASNPLQLQETKILFFQGIISCMIYKYVYSGHHNRSTAWIQIPFPDTCQDKGTIQIYQIIQCLISSSLRFKSLFKNLFATISPV